MRAPIGIFLTGTFIGSLVGAMAQVVPYPVVIVSVIALLVSSWVEADDSIVTLCINVGLFLGGIFGAMSQIIPFGVPLVMGMKIGLSLWKSRTGVGRQGVPGMIVIPLLIIVGTGLFFNFSYTDFCTGGVIGGADVCANPATWTNGYATGWTGCVTTCGINAFSILGSSIFSNFILAGTSGDYVGLLLSLFNIAVQSPLPTIATILTIAIGAILILLSLGIGVSGNVLASGLGITVNEAGTRLAQSYGIGLIIFGLVFAGFGFWIGTVFQGTFGFALGTSFLLLLVTTYFYGLYIQGKSTVSL